ncbi:MAG: phosphomannomutase [Nevskiaceae bacterium]|nr:MAG: phosphomannomutase [Nevskiaceae bacterium]TBR74856.1 MAG: phosphomannomutase [Nevskiaceae bacterium]
MKTNLSALSDAKHVRFGTSGARGLVADMTDAVCYAYVKAFLEAVVPNADTVVLGHDLRPSSPRIAAACALAIHDSGKEVMFVGELPTPALAFYCRKIQSPGVMVTGSHIPFDRNGIKFYRADAEISKADEQAMLATELVLPEDCSAGVLPPASTAALDLYVKRYAEFFEPMALAGMKVAVYEHSSVARDVLPVILESLGAYVIRLGRTDGFVAIDTEALRPEDVRQAQAWAAEHRFDAILSTDGDADRALIGDETGKWLRGDVVGILCAQVLGADVVVTPVSCNTALEKSGWFKRTVRTKIGSPYVIAGMEVALARHGGTVVGFEANGGFLLGSDVICNRRKLAALPTRDAVLPMLALLTFARQRRCRLSDLANDLPARYSASDRLQNFPRERSLQLLATLQADVASAQQLMVPGSGPVVHTDTTDGLRLTFANGDIVHLRPSGNAPELRCYAEADAETQAQALCASCLERIR